MDNRSGARRIGKWLVLGAVPGVLSGLASALFLLTLDTVTNVRLAHPWIVGGLPVAGLGSVLLYRRVGGKASEGIPLIFTAVRQPGTPVPGRMAPLVLLGTLLTHLFGGSAGREGTAIQMAGGLTAAVQRRLHLTPSDAAVLMQAAIAAGFASVFGTPLAGAIFAFEAVKNGPAVTGRRCRAVVPAVIAAVLIGDRITRLFVAHTAYMRPPVPPLSVDVAVHVAVAALAFGLAASVFVRLLHGVKVLAGSFNEQRQWAAFWGGVVVVALTVMMGTDVFNGLGVPTIEAAVRGDILQPSAFLKKTVMTAVTVGSGFQGGEVTPLFYIGATLGNAMGHVIGISPAFLAALGFVAVFAGATKTPWACTVMALELFGMAPVPYALVACFLSAAVSGRHTIYTTGR